MKVIFLRSKALSFPLPHPKAPCYPKLHFCRPHLTFCKSSGPFLQGSAKSIMPFLYNQDLRYINADEGFIAVLIIFCLIIIIDKHWQTVAAPVSAAASSSSSAGVFSCTVSCLFSRSALCVSFCCLLCSFLYRRLFLCCLFCPQPPAKIKEMHNNTEISLLFFIFPPF